MVQPSFYVEITTGRRAFFTLRPCNGQCDVERAKSARRLSEMLFLASGQSHTMGMLPAPRGVPIRTLRAASHMMEVLTVVTDGQVGKQNFKLMPS